jgi:tRNA G18 (ribose-2'-O)-methylase SpoU
MCIQATGHDPASGWGTGCRSRKRPWHSRPCHPADPGAYSWRRSRTQATWAPSFARRSAAGVDGLWLSADSVAPDHPKVLRASAGQWFRLPLWITEDPVQQMTTWQAAGVQLVATNAAATPRFWNVDLTQPTVFLLGNEGAGLSAPLQHYATTQVSIPMQADVESLNVAVAAALLMYEACRQRQSG